MEVLVGLVVLRVVPGPPPTLTQAQDGHRELKVEGKEKVDPTAEVAPDFGHWTFFSFLSGCFFSAFCSCCGPFLVLYYLRIPCFRYSFILCIKSLHYSVLWLLWKSRNLLQSLLLSRACS